MAPTPLLATFRLIFRYTVAAVVHKAQFYLPTVPSLDISGYNTNPRGGFAGVGVSTLGNAFFTIIAPFYRPADTSFDSWELLERVGSVWAFRSAGAITVVPTGTIAYQPANQYCIAGKDTGNKNLPRYVYEGAFGTALKITSVGGLVSVARAMVNYHFDPDHGAINTDAFAWSYSRGLQYANRWLSSVVDTNEKLRRVRRIK